MAIDSKNLLVWVKAMSRGQALPLDSTEVWDSLESAQDYAKNNATAYVGQTVKVIENDAVSVYVIDSNKELIRIPNEIDISGDAEIFTSAEEPQDAKDGDIWIDIDEDPSLSPFLQEEDVVNDLITNDATSPLSAAMGKVLKEQVEKNAYPTGGKSGDVLSLDANGKTKWSTISIPKYKTIFTDDALIGEGALVPHPFIDDVDKFLKGDGTWSEIPDGDDMTGASESSAGKHGLAPAPVAGDQDKFLKGDGTWSKIPDYNDMTGASATTAGKHGLVPAPATGDQDKYLKGDGSWSAISIPEVPKYETLRSDKVSEGEGVLVPNSSANDVKMYLRGDGSWTTPIHVGNDAPENAEVGALWVDTDEASSQSTDPILRKSDIVNNLSTDSSTKVLSAKQGMELSRLIEEKTLTYPAGGAAGDALVLGDDGSVKWGTISAPEYKNITESGVSENEEVLVVKGSPADNNKFLKGDGSWGTPTNTTYKTMNASGASANEGVLVPNPGSTDGTKYLRNDGTWTKPEGKTYTVFTDTTLNANDPALVPTPSTKASDCVLRANGTWTAFDKDDVGIYTSEVEPTNSTDGDLWIDPISTPTDATVNYEHPTYVLQNLGFYKFATDKIGSISEVAAVTKQDIINIGFNEFTTSDQEKLASAVLLTEQALTEAQKEQVRNNIGVTDAIANAISAAIGAAMNDSY